MKFEKGKYYFNRKKYSYLTFQFDGVSMNCMSARNIKGGLFTDSDLNEEEWEKELPLPSMKPYVWDNSESNIQANILSFYNKLKEFKGEFWNPAELVYEYEKHFNITIQKEE